MLTAIWLAKTGSEQTLGAGDGGTSTPLPGPFARLGAPVSAGSPPNITAVSSPVQGSSCTITGVSFGAVQGSIRLGGLLQNIISWADTSISFTVNLGNSKYGPTTVVVYPDASVNTASFPVTVVPAATQNYVNVTNALLASQRITTVPVDLAVGDQILWGPVVGGAIGDVTVRNDGSFSAAGDVVSFSVQVNDGTGWGTVGDQAFSIVTNNFVSSKFNGTWRYWGDVRVFLNGTWRQGLSTWMKYQGQWRKFWPQEDQLPIVQWLVPGDGDTLSGNVRFEAYALDDVRVDRVEFNIAPTGTTNWTTLGSVTAAPWRVTANVDGFIVNGIPQEFDIVAIATDSANRTRESEALTITIDTTSAPIVALTAPANNSVVWGTNVSMQASASDLDGTIANVKFYLDGSLLFTDTTVPYTQVLNTTLYTNGQHTLVATATDDEGGVSSSYPVTLFINNLSPPVLTAGTPQEQAKTFLYWPVSTNQASGSLYVVVTTNPTQPTAAQIKQGRDAANLPAPDSFVFNVTSVGTYAHYTAREEYNPNTTYYAHWVQTNEQNKDSARVTQSLTSASVLNVLCTPTAVSGINTVSSGSFAGSVPVTTPSVGVTVTGAVGTVTLSWSRVSGVDATFGGTPTNRSFSRTAFLTQVDPQVTYTGTFRVLATDSTGSFAYGPDITVTTTHIFDSSFGGEEP